MIICRRAKRLLYIPLIATVLTYAYYTSYMNYRYAHGDYHGLASPNGPSSIEMVPVYSEDEATFHMITWDSAAAYYLFWPLRQYERIEKRFIIVDWKGYE